MHHRKNKDSKKKKKKDSGNKSDKGKEKDERKTVIKTAEDIEKSLLARKASALMGELLDYEPFYQESKLVVTIREVEISMTLMEALSLDESGSFKPDGVNTDHIARFPGVFMDLSEPGKEFDDDWDYSEIYVQSVRILEYENEFPLGLYWAREDFSRYFDPSSARSTTTTDQLMSPKELIGGGMPACKLEAELCRKFNLGAYSPSSSSSSIFPQTVYLARDMAHLTSVLTFCGFQNADDVYNGTVTFCHTPQFRPLPSGEENEKWVVLRADHAVAEMAVHYARGYREQNGGDLPFPHRSIFLFDDDGSRGESWLYDDDEESGSPSEETRATWTQNRSLFCKYKYAYEDPHGESRDEHVGPIHDVVLVSPHVATCLFRDFIEEIVPAVRRGASDGRRMGVHLSFFKRSATLSRHYGDVVPENQLAAQTLYGTCNPNRVVLRLFAPLDSTTTTTTTPGVVCGEEEGDEEGSMAEASVNLLRAFKAKVCDTVLTLKMSLEVRFVVFKKHRDGDDDLGGEKKKRFCATARTFSA